jgi:hypothetical protein
VILRYLLYILSLGNGFILVWFWKMSSILCPPAEYEWLPSWQPVLKSTLSYICVYFVLLYTFIMLVMFTFIFFIYFYMTVPYCLLFLFENIILYFICYIYLLCGNGFILVVLHSRCSRSRSTSKSTLCMCTLLSVILARLHACTNARDSFTLRFVLAN